MILVLTALPALLVLGDRFLAGAPEEGAGSRRQGKGGG